MPKVKRYPGERFGKLILVSPAGAKPQSIWFNWLCRCDCGNETTVATSNLIGGVTKSCGCLRSIVKLGPLNPQWKGDDVGYAGVHDWIRDRYTKPLLCEHCHTYPPLDLANKSNTYQRDLIDWWYLCRRCHMTLDGRIQLTKDRESKRKIPIPPCAHCGQSFYRKSGQRTAKFCSRVCFFAAGGRYNKLERSPIKSCNFG